MTYTSTPPAQKGEYWIRRAALKEQPAKWDGEFLWTRFGPIRRDKLDGFEFCRVLTPDEVAKLTTERDAAEAELEQLRNELAEIHEAWRL